MVRIKSTFPPYSPEECPAGVAGSGTEVKASAGGCLANQAEGGVSNLVPVHALLALVTAQQDLNISILVQKQGALFARCLWKL